VTDLTLPAGPGVRVDTYPYEGYRVPPFYDSLLAEVIVWDASRIEAIARMKRALGELSFEEASRRRRFIWPCSTIRAWWRAPAIPATWRLTFPGLLRQCLEQTT
jgi:acetyl/propionyl-CoA carboxylase alpha subunit